MDPNVLVAGETLVDFLPDAPGPLADVEGFTRRPGGAPANVAVNLRQLDCDPWFWTRVGDDPFGDFLAETLRDRGVREGFVERDPDAKTTLAFVSHDEAADASFTFYRDDTADTRLRPGAVPEAVLDSIEWVYACGVPLSSGSSREAITELVGRANERDCSVIFDPNARPELWDGDFADTVDDVLPETDVVKATTGDLREAGFEGDDPLDLAEQVCERGPHTVFLTLGEAGSVAYASDDAPWGPATVEHGGYDVDVVDTTGAGDAFTAGVTAALVRGERDLTDVLAFGNAVAAAATTEAGGMPELPAVSEILTSVE